MTSTTMIVVMIIGFVVFAIASSAIFYFARYYFKTDQDDKEVFAKKPIEFGLKWEGPQKKGLGREPEKPKAELATALEKTRSTFWGRISDAVSSSLVDKSLGKNVRDEIEEALYMSDMGPKTAGALLEQVTESLSRNERADLETVRGALKRQMESILNNAGEHDLFSVFDNRNPSGTGENQEPIVWMIVGVNGAGKTTTIGKLAAMAHARRLKTLIIAGDTFRAAADSQLKAWAERALAEIHSPENVKDPSAMVYSGLERGKAMAADLIIVDTAGRLHTQEHLMEELRKMKRVMTKVLPNAPQERILVIDANAGQNALMQAREFNAALELTGVVVTKMDGSAKGGIVLGITGELGVPVTHIGIGESVEDLRPFSAKEFVEAVL